ncbi:MAG: hypothetical protein ACYCV7_11085 [Acidimicrobiales bacterium]
MTGPRCHAWAPARHGRFAVLGGGLLAALLVTAALLGSSSTAWGATQAPTLSLNARHVAQSAQGIELLATLGAPAGAPPLAGVEVSFSVQLQEFAGAPMLTLGTATTDAAGEAAFIYRPTWTGRQILVATATDTAGNTLASATTTLTAPSATYPFAGTVRSLRPDGTIGKAVVGVLLAIVVLVWIALIAVVVRVNHGLAARGA